MSSAVSGLGMAKLTFWYSFFSGTALRNTGASLEKRLAKIGGGISVVTKVIRTAILKTSWGIIPLAMPIPAIIKATSPRGTMPKPIFSAPRGLKLRNKAGKPQPTSFPTTAKTT